MRLAARNESKAAEANSEAKGAGRKEWEANLEAKSAGGKEWEAEVFFSIAVIQPWIRLEQYRYHLSFKLINMKQKSTHVLHSLHHISRTN